MSRLSQASHEQAGLFLLHVQSVLKCFHVLYYSSLETVCQPFMPPAGGRQFTHILESSGPLAAFLVDQNVLSSFVSMVSPVAPQLTL
jgi:hypothetical protein